MPSNSVISNATPRPGDTNVRVNLHRARGLIIEPALIGMLFNERPTRHMTELHSVRRLLEREIACAHVARYIPATWVRPLDHREAYTDLLIVYAAEILAEWMVESGSRDEVLLEIVLQRAPRRCSELQLKLKLTRATGGVASATPLEPQPTPATRIRTQI